VSTPFLRVGFELLFQREQLGKRRIRIRLFAPSFIGSPRARRAIIIAIAAIAAPVTALRAGSPPFLFATLTMPTPCIPFRPARTPLLLLAIPFAIMIAIPRSFALGARCALGRFDLCCGYFRRRCLRCSYRLTFRPLGRLLTPTARRTFSILALAPRTIWTAGTPDFDHFRLGVRYWYCCDRRFR
jgi:hypothetical protein